MSILFLTGCIFTCRSSIVFFLIEMPLEHLQIELKHNEDPVFGGKASTVTFFTDISTKHASLQEDLSDPRLKQLIFPLKEEVNMQPFDELIPLKEGCKLKTDEEMNYCSRELCRREACRQKACRQSA